MRSVTGCTPCASSRCQYGTEPKSGESLDYVNLHWYFIYQETQSLPGKWQRVVLENEIRITGIFTGVLAKLMTSGVLPRISPRQLDLVAHNISVLGHMWTFRRWFLANHYSIDEYIDFQTRSILGMCKENAL